MSSKSVLASVATLSVAASKEWAVVPGTAATTLVGVGAYSDTLMVAGAGDNGSGAFVEQYDGTKWVNDQVQGGLLMDAAASEKAIVGVSMWTVFLSTDNGNTFESLETVKGLSQSASIFGTGSDIGLVGSFTVESGVSPVSGVAHSGDAGSTWSVSEIPGGYVRYGSFPSQDTWYVTAGMWPSYLSHTEEAATLNSHLIMSAKGNMNFGHTNRTFSESAGYWGSVSKTTDGGATWSEVFHTSGTDNFYFNGISCTSDTHCVTVGEGASSTDNTVLVTFDGGSTWTKSDVSFEDNAVSCTGVAWMSETEGWVGATAKSGRNLQGLFYKTNDGGKSYALDQQLDNCFIMDMDSVGESGVAACISSSGSTASVATYK